STLNVATRVSMGPLWQQRPAQRGLPQIERSCFYGGMAKGAQTRELVLREALDQASMVGLNGLTIGTLADRLSMSKSGLFAHFRSKDQLQVDTLDYAADRFRLHVVLPALREPAGEPR